MDYEFVEAITILKFARREITEEVDTSFQLPANGRL
jgi:hypothetical protein